MIGVGVAGAGVALVVLLATGSDEVLTPEQQVRRSLEQIVEAADAQDIGALMDRVSERYRGGGRDKAELRGLLFMQFRRASWSRVVLTDTEVTMQSPYLADVSTGALLARGESIVPSDAQIYRFELTFEREEDEEWRLTRADYQIGVKR